MHHGRRAMAMVHAHGHAAHHGQLHVHNGEAPLALPPGLSQFDRTPRRARARVRDSCVCIVCMHARASFFSKRAGARSSSSSSARVHARDQSIDQSIDQPLTGFDAFDRSITTPRSRVRRLVEPGTWSRRGWCPGPTLTRPLGGPLRDLPPQPPGLRDRLRGLRQVHRSEEHTSEL